MNTIIGKVEELFNVAFSIAFPQWETAVNLISVSRSTQVQFGHYQCNSALTLSKILKLPPREIAQKVVDTLEVLPKAYQDWIEKWEVAGPGFINLTLKTSCLNTLCQTMLTSPRLGMAKPSSRQRIVIDFSSPNTAKEMHVGHLRSTIIGDCLANLFEFLGYDVLRLNHIGDWGTAFGMLIAYLKKCQSDFLTGENTADLLTLMQWYKASKQLFDTDADFKKASQQEVVLLQSGEEHALKAWKMICEISLKAYQEIYALLKVKLITRGESFYNPYLDEVIQALEKKKLITVSDGAKCLFLEGFENRQGEPLPLIVKKSDGGYNYASTDLAALKHRVEVEHADRIIYVTDAGQAVHFEMIFSAAEKAGFVDRTQVRLDHVPFGLVLGPDGKKFKTRSGETEKLIDLLTQGITKAKALLLDRQAQTETHYTIDQIEEISQALGINAIKYADLACNRTSDYQFSYEKMLRFEGNTAAFLMYAYVRIAGIKRKIESKGTHLSGEAQIAIAHPAEITLAVHLVQFAEILEVVTLELYPNTLCNYLYELANKFNIFFRDCRVQGSEEEKSRLLLCELVSKVLRQGLEILGLHVIERM